MWPAFIITSKLHGHFITFPNSKISKLFCLSLKFVMWPMGTLCPPPPLLPRDFAPPLFKLPVFLSSYWTINIVIREEEIFFRDEFVLTKIGLEIL